MNPLRETSAAIAVIKIGGGLIRVPSALGRVCALVSEIGRDRRILVVPGGGPFADLVREFDRAMRLSPDSAHWMAILAMDQYAHVLVERITGAVLVEEPGAIPEATKTAGVAVLAPSRWMRSADVLPHSWEVTSDSIAAFIAGAVDAACLILIKPVADAREPVDPFFATALPEGMPYSVVGCDRLEELAGQLSV
jgi:5-(aminomethyl)-3-furanmethanol phosphate kinase